MIVGTDIYHRRTINNEDEYKFIQKYFIKIWAWTLIIRLESYWEVAQPQEWIEQPPQKMLTFKIVS